MIIFQPYLFSNIILWKLIMKNSWPNHNHDLHSYGQLWFLFILWTKNTLCTFQRSSSIWSKFGTFTSRSSIKWTYCHQYNTFRIWGKHPTKMCIKSVPFLHQKELIGLNSSQIAQFKWCSSVMYFFVIMSLNLHQITYSA